MFTIFSSVLCPSDPFLGFIIRKSSVCAVFSRSEVAVGVCASCYIIVLVRYLFVCVPSLYGMWDVLPGHNNSSGFYSAEVGKVNNSGKSRIVTVRVRFIIATTSDTFVILDRDIASCDFGGNCSYIVLCREDFLILRQKHCMPFLISIQYFLN